MQEKVETLLLEYHVIKQHLKRWSVLFVGLTKSFEGLCSIFRSESALLSILGGEKNTVFVIKIVVGKQDTVQDIKRGGEAITHTHIEREGEKDQHCAF